MMGGRGEKDLDTLYELIDGIGIAMMTTRRPDGRLVSRPMATQDRAEVADLWFVANLESHKMDEIEHDPHVNLAYLDGDTNEWVSVSGKARISRDRDRIRELYDRSWKMWFPEVDEARNGDPDDPRIGLIFVDTDSVSYMERDKSAPAVLYELAKGYVTGEKPDVGTVRSVETG